MENGLETPKPESIYAERLARRKEVVETLDRRDGQVANARLALFAIAGVVAFLAFARDAFSGWWLLAPGVAFVALLVVHDRLLTRRARAARAVLFYEQGLSRLDGSWPGKGIDGAHFEDPEHPYARDLDLFGVGSLFERLCTARTAAGEAMLAQWLSAPAAPAVIAARQAAVAELRDRLDLREDLAVLGADVRAQVNPERLAAWGAAPGVLPGNGWWIAAGLLAAAGIGAVVAWPLGAGPLPLVVVGVVDYLVLRRLRDPLGQAAAALEKPGRDLTVLAQVLARLEREPVQAPRLQALHAMLVDEGAPASGRISSLARRIELVQAQHNQFFAPIAFLLLWSVHFGYAIEAWRRRNGAQVARWLEAVGELEALSSLAAYSFENPADPFPVVEEGAARFEGEALAHPLLQGAVANDIALGGALQALVISGSNMSGKSTMLRTVGVNAVLAQAGAPVRARRLRLSPLRVGGTLRVQDSLQQGTSRFYAELTRLKQLVELARGSGGQLLFLIDEIFHGTNSHDRRIGAEAILRGLIDRGAIGLLTTHDLALAQAAEALAPRAANVHFEDHLAEGRLAFDYTMRPGVVQKSNALELMRAVGLEV